MTKYYFLNVFGQMAKISQKIKILLLMRFNFHCRIFFNWFFLSQLSKCLHQFDFLGSIAENNTFYKSHPLNSPFWCHQVGWTPILEPLPRLVHFQNPPQLWGGKLGYKKPMRKCVMSTHHPSMVGAGSLWQPHNNKTLSSTFA